MLFWLLRLVSRHWRFEVCMVHYYVFSEWCNTIAVNQTWGCYFCIFITKIFFAMAKPFFYRDDYTILAIALSWCHFVVLPQRLKAALSQQSPSGHSMGVMGMGSSPMVPQRAEQSQLLVQQPDAPSPAQPQVHCWYKLTRNITFKWNAI